MKIEIFPTGGNIIDHPFARKNPEWAFHSHAVIDDHTLCGISGDYLCYDTSLEDQNGLPSCPKCAKRVTKERSK